MNRPGEYSAIFDRLYRLTKKLGDECSKNYAQCGEVYDPLREFAAYVPHPHYTEIDDDHLKYAGYWHEIMPERI